MNGITYEIDDDRNEQMEYVSVEMDIDDCYGILHERRESHNRYHLARPAIINHDQNLFLELR